MRRSPEDARALILDAAEKQFSTRGPDASGLKDVAKRAGVSHGLITHYFGTYDLLVIAVLDRRVVRAREQAVKLLAESPPGPELMLQFLVGYLSDPLHVRLITWALLTGKEDALLPLSAGALRPIMDAIAQRRRSEFGPKSAKVETVELDIAVSLAAGFGFALGRDLFARALGRPPISPEAFAHRLAMMIQATLKS